MSNHTRKLSFCWFLGFLKHHSVGLFSLKAWSISWFVSVIRANGFPYCSLLLWRLSNPCHFWLIFLMEMIFLPCRWVSEAWNYWLCQRWDSFYLFYLQDFMPSCKQGFHMQPCWAFLFSRNGLGTLFYPYGWSILEATDSVSWKQSGHRAHTSRIHWSTRGWLCSCCAYIFGFLLYTMWSLRTSKDVNGLSWLTVKGERACSTLNML